MTRPEVHEIIVTDEEFEDMPRFFEADIDKRLLLKRKGLPMTGIFYPKLDTANYEYQIMKLFDMTTSYKWKAL